ncbi:MAG: DUF362 domain-containing protein [Acidobacteriaceae bacterium]|nr:DUF362 domain-containing protein [Acidobacteriaceae bacterium]
MKPRCSRSSLTRRDLLAAAAAAPATALTASRLAAANAPSSSVSIVRCRTYDDFHRQLATAFNNVGGIEKLVRGKTVAIKLNLTGGPDAFPVSPALPFRTDARTLTATVALLAQAGARRVRIIESFFPASQDLALWSRYGIDVNGIGKLGVPVVWDNVQNLGPYKSYTRLKVPSGGLMYPSYDMNQALVDCDVYFSLAKMKDHGTAGVTLSMKNNFGNSPCSLYGGDCGPDGNEQPTEVRVAVLHRGTTKAPKGVAPELDPNSPRDPGYRVPRVTVDQVGIRPIDVAIIDGVETVRGGEGPWLRGLEKMTPGVIVVGRNPVCTDSVAMAVMGYNPRADRGTAPFHVGDNHLKLAESVGLGTTDLTRIEVVGLSIDAARINFGPGAVGKKLNELKS